MKVQKSLLVLGAVTGITLAGITGLGVASAASGGSGQDGIIDKLAARFNLNKDDVAAVFEETKAEHEAEHQQKLEDRLTQAVKDGKLTEEQKAKILAKLNELHENHDNWKQQTFEERQQVKQQMRDQLKQWAKDNNIPLQYVLFMHGDHPSWQQGDAGHH